jgi:hypothetical protein
MESWWGKTLIQRGTTNGLILLFRAWRLEWSIHSRSWTSKRASPYGARGWSHRSTLRWGTRRRVLNGLGVAICRMLSISRIRSLKDPRKGSSISSISNTNANLRTIKYNLHSSSPTAIAESWTWWKGSSLYNMYLYWWRLSANQLEDLMCLSSLFRARRINPMKVMIWKESTSSLARGRILARLMEAMCAKDCWLIW